MNFITATTTCLRKYVDFSGRASRSEYWYFFLFTTMVSTALGMIFKNTELPNNIFTLATMLPNMSVCSRRMHDIGKSGKWAILQIIPIANLLVIIWSCKDSEPGENEYGANPKGE